ncbi:hypothetical protein BSKO_08156 [Bryopsis sp. KO-2023]|nr:hypothetical protein BSKO_08156 [Bryopsis sp. KO-2023]
MATPSVESEVQALLTIDGTRFEALVSELMSPDNDRRKMAELVLTQLKNHPDLCVQYLVNTLRTSASKGNRSFCALILKKVLTKGDPLLWPRISKQVQDMVKNELLVGLREEQERDVCRKVCHTVSELGAFVADMNGGWNELVPSLYQFLQSGSAGLKESALSVLSFLATKDKVEPVMAMPNLHNTLQTCLNDESVEVRKAAFDAVCGIVRSLDEASQRNTFQPLIPHMLGCLGHFLNIGAVDAAHDALENMIEVADMIPKFLRKQLPEIVNAMVQLAASESLEEGARSLAAEFLITVCERREQIPQLLKRLPNFIQNLFEVLMPFLLDIEDVIEWHQAAELEDEDSGHGELYEFGQECLDRVAMSFRGKVVVPVAGVMLNAWIQDQDWKKRHATLICLAQIAEGCAKVMLKEIDALTEMCLRGLTDPVAKVRWAACQAIGQMCMDLGPHLQASQHQVVVPRILAAMDDNENPRVQAHASAALVNFCEACEVEDLVPYLDSLMEKLIQLLRCGSKVVQEGALTALASVADRAQDAFIKYYDSVMPLLRGILLSATDRKYQMLRAKALECVSLVGMAVGRDCFRNDAKDILQYLNQLNNSHLEPDDPIMSYMMQVGVRLCKCLGHEFLPYMGIVMPPLLKAAAQDPDVKVKSLDEEDFDTADDDEDTEKVFLGDRILTIRTSILEEKATACQMLCCYVDELKDGFVPYVKEVTHLMVPLLKFYFAEDVRRAAVQTLPPLLEAAIIGARKGVMNVAFVGEMVNFTWPALMSMLGKEVDLEALATVLEATSEIVEMLDKTLLTKEMVDTCFSKLHGVLCASEERRKNRIEDDQERDPEEYDELELVAMDEEEESERNVLEEVGTCIAAFLKQYGDTVFPYVESLMAITAKLLDKSRSPEERRIGICVLDDLLEHSTAAREKYADRFFPILLETMREEDADLRQCAVYGIGVLADVHPQFFATHLNTVLPLLVSMIQHPQAREKDELGATENAVSSLGKIFHKFPDAVEAGVVAQVWLPALPLVEDLSEAKEMHSLLVKMVEGGDARVLGEGNQNLAKIVQVFVRVLGGGNQLVSNEFGARIVGLIGKLQASVGVEVVQTAAGSLTSSQQKAFQDYMEGKVQAG